MSVRTFVSLFRIVIMLQQYYISHLSLRIFASEYDLIKVLIGYSLLATINSEVFEV